MATIFDDLIDPYSRKLPRRRGGADELLGLPQRQSLAPPTNPSTTFVGSEPSTLQPELSTRPRLVAPSDVQPGLPPLDAVGMARRKAYELDHTTAVNNDKGFGGRLLDVIRQAVIGAGTAYNNASGRPEDRLYAALGGAAAGGLQGGFDPAVDERRKLEYDRARAYQDVGEAERQAAYDLNNQYKLTQMQNTEEDNRRQYDELERKKKADADKVANWDRILQDKKRGRDLEETKINDLRDYRKFLMDQGLEMNKAKIRQIEERLKDYDLDRESRERIAGQNNATRMGTSAMQGANRIGIEAIKAGAAATKSKADVAKRIADIRSGGEQRGVSEEQITARINEYINNLPPELRP